jgi:hypothetical protein
MKIRIWSAIALLAAFGSSPLFAASSSCIDCHGNVDTMKAMVAPPVVNAEEGEG